jgi:hypothetical protein
MKNILPLHLNLKSRNLDEHFQMVIVTRPLLLSSKEDIPVAIKFAKNERTTLIVQKEPRRFEKLTEDAT